MFSSVIWDSRYGSDITVASPPAVLWMTPTVAISAEDWKHLPSFYTVINSTASLASLPSMKLRVCVCVCVRVYCMCVCLCRKFYLLWRCGELTAAFLHEVGWWSAFFLRINRRHSIRHTASIPAKASLCLALLSSFKRSLLSTSLCAYSLWKHFMISENKRSVCWLNCWWLLSVHYHHLPVRTHFKVVAKCLRLKKTILLNSMCF